MAIRPVEDFNGRFRTGKNPAKINILLLHLAKSSSAHAILYENYNEKMKKNAGSNKDS